LILALSLAELEVVLEDIVLVEEPKRDFTVIVHGVHRPKN
jgi:hypothetical protein